MPSDMAGNQPIFLLTTPVVPESLTANLMAEVWQYVSIDPHLQPLYGEDLHSASANTKAGARLDVAACGFWGGRFDHAFFDVRVFNPHTKSNCQQNLTSTYRENENIKKRAYEQRVRENEYGSFPPPPSPPYVIAHWRPRKNSHCELQKTCLHGSF